MPKTIIDLLEMIEIDDRHRKRDPFTFCQGNVVIRGIEKGVPTEQAGQRVVAGQTAHFLFFTVDAKQQLNQVPSDRQRHDQRNTDGDGFGNLCDPDFNGNGVVDPADFSLLKSRFGQSGFPDQDLNGNGVVDPFDFSLLKSKFGQPPGPSGISP